MQKRCRATVIVTVHNSEQYLDACLRSACAQTLQEIEILCVDGKSSDASPQILKQFQEKDARIRILNDSNASYGHKINAGIQHASGEYIAILETDDWYAPHMLERLYETAEKYQLDYADADFCEFLEVGGEIFSYKKNKYRDKDVYGRIIEPSEEKEITVSTGAVWTGLYRRSFLLEKKIRLNESPGASFQDTSFGFQTGIMAKRCCHLAEPLYYYRIDNSGSSVKDNQKIYEIAYELEYLYSWLNERGIRNNRIWNQYYYTKYAVFYWNACRLSGSARTEFLKLYRQVLQKDIKDGHIKHDASDPAYKADAFLLLDDFHAFESTLQEADQRKDYPARILSMIKNIGSSDIVIFGGGIRGRQVLELYSGRQKQVKCICDNEKAGRKEEASGLDILSVPDAAAGFPKASFIIAGFRHSSEMRQQLLGLGVPEENIFIYK